MQNLHRRFDRNYIGQICGGDFATICGLLRMYELYQIKYFSRLSYLYGNPAGEVHRKYKVRKLKYVVHVLFNKEWLGYYRQRQCVFSITNSDFW